MNSLGYRIFAFVSLLCGFTLALPYALHDVNAIKSPSIKDTRSANTCEDPSLAHTVFEAFSAAGTAHRLNFREVFETTNSESGTLVFANELPAFDAWRTQQEFTSPLFQLGRSNPNEVIYVLGTDADTPPVVTGFSAPVIVAWVYSTQVCDSVPLMSSTLASSSDHFYTIDSSVHDALIASGWSDTGVVAFVLPFYSS